MASKGISVAAVGPRLLEKTEVATGTMAFEFEKPGAFDYKAGQTADLRLYAPSETDDEGNIRTFSIASAPFEEHLMFCTRMRETAFKRSLNSMPLGSVVKIDPASGSFTLHRDPDRAAVFLAGGIGITPFLSMIRQADHDRLPRQLYLFYSNRRPEDAAFLDDLSSVAASNPKFHLICTMTAMSKSAQVWKGETGYIDQLMLSRHLSDLNGPVYYVAGPPSMVTGTRQMLAGAGVDEDDIRADEFCGY